MTDNYILASAERQAAIEAAKVAFFMRGGKIKVGPGVPDRHMAPPRKDWVDPETVLARRRREPNAARREFQRLMTERHSLRRMAEAL